MDVAPLGAKAAAAAAAVPGTADIDYMGTVGQAVPVEDYTPLAVAAVEEVAGERIAGTGYTLAAVAAVGEDAPQELVLAVAIAPEPMEAVVRREPTEAGEVVVVGAAAVVCYDVVVLRAAEGDRILHAAAVEVVTGEVEEVGDSCLNSGRSLDNIALGGQSAAY